MATAGAPTTVSQTRSAPTRTGFVRLVWESVLAWLEDYAPSMGAALAYYTLFSLAPMLLIVIAVAGMLFGAEAARGEIMAQLGGLMGTEGAQAVQGLLESANKPAAGVVASVVGLLTLLIGATSVFGELQSALDRIWRAPAAREHSGIVALLRSPASVVRNDPRDWFSAAGVARHQRRAVSLWQVVGRLVWGLASGVAGCQPARQPWNRHCLCSR